MNIGDEYIGRKRSLKYWRDTHLKMRGPVVLQLQEVFAEDWFFATGEQPVGPAWYPATEQGGDQLAQVIAGGPDGEIDVFHSLFFAAINEASDRITLATSYFVPTPALVDGPRDGGAPRRARADHGPPLQRSSLDGRRRARVLRFAPRKRRGNLRVPAGNAAFENAHD